MAYFVIIFGVFMWLIIIAGAMMVTRSVSSLNGAYRYVWRTGLGSLLGIIAANLALVVILVPGFMILGKINVKHDGIHNIAGLILGLTATIGPLVASLIGWVIGGVIGFLIANRSCHMTLNSQFDTDALRRST